MRKIFFVLLFVAACDTECDRATEMSACRRMCEPNPVKSYDRSLGKHSAPICECFVTAPQPSVLDTIVVKEQK